jgi:hypothetical protein
MTTRDALQRTVYAVLVVVCVFVLSAAAAGLWIGLALRFVWIAA